MFDLVYDFNCSSNIETSKNIIYKIANGNNLTLDIFYSDKENIGCATVILLHGSAPMDNIKDLPIFQSWGNLLATNNIDTVICNWKPDENNDDIKDLISFLRQNETRLKLNCKKISILAFSAGAEDGIDQALSVNEGFIKKIAVYYGKINPNSIDDIQSNYKIPFLIVMGALDDIFDVSVNDEFIKKAKAAGWESEKIIHSKGEHGFDAFNECEETNMVIDKTIEFIKS